MTTTDYMLLPYIDASQNQKETTHNDGLLLNEKWLTTPLTKSASAGNITLTATEWRESQHILVTGAVVANRQLIFPASMRGTKLVTNDQATASQPILLTKGSTQVSLPVGSAAAVFLDATSNGLYAVIGGVASGFSVASLVPTEPFFGARVHRSADTANLTANTETTLHLQAAANGTGWDTVDYDSGFPETSSWRPSFFLGTKTFDGATAVDPTTNQITLTAHGLVTGMGPYTYNNGGGTTVVGLTNNTDYWIIKIDANNVALATSRALALAGTQVDITADGVGASHRLDGSGRFMVPSGVKRIELAGNMQLTEATSQTAMGIKFRKNGTTNFAGSGGVTQANTSTTAANGKSVHARSSGLVVTGGDYFEMSAWATSAAAILADSGQRTWFAVRVLEYDGAPAEQIEFDFLGTPANGATVFQKVFARKTIMNDEFANSQAYMKTAPVGTIVFDVQRNAVSVGSITFASANTGTFTTAEGTYETFSEGDRLEVISPSDLKGGADLMVTLWAWRSV